MIIKQGEVRRIGIEVISTTEQDFIIEAADFIVKNENKEIVETGIPTIDNHKILTLFSAIEKGKFYVEFTYRIGPEIIKDSVYVQVL